MPLLRARWSKLRLCNVSLCSANSCSAILRGASLSALCLVLAMSLCLPTLLPAQSTGGRIIGRVADPTGAVIANVKVTLINEATGVTTDTTTNDNGDYAFPQVPVGTYRMEFDLTGFKKNVQRSVNLDLNAVLTINSVLQIGETRETV